MSSQIRPMLEFVLPNSEPVSPDTSNWSSQKPRSRLFKSPPFFMVDYAILKDFSY